MALKRPIDLKRCTIKIKDGGSNQITVKVGEGNLSFTEKRNVEYIRDRGVLSATRLGDEEPVDVSFDFTWEEITSISGDTTPTVKEALQKIGAASSWASSDADTCAPYAVDIEVTHDPDCSGTSTSAQDEVVLISDFRWESMQFDYKAATISVTGKANVTTVTATRV